jgi:hypothetical protein
LNSN